jgi:PIN domain nuclease of toxin-antitoxin system
VAGNLMVVLDTAALIYWSLDPQKMSARARKAVDDSDLLRVSSISIWEIGIKIKRRKLVLPLPLKIYVEKLKLADRLEIMPVTETIWMKNLELVWKHKDPADRTIVAMAILLQSPLVTSDQKIRRFYKQAIW